MKVNEKIKEKLLENFGKWKEELNEKIDSYLDSIRNAERVEDVMFLKKRLLLKLIRCLPLGNKFCYFCLMKELGEFNTCADCPYAKYHRECYWGYSDYATIISLLGIAYEAIDRLYYVEEKYEKGSHNKNE